MKKKGKGETKRCLMKMNLAYYWWPIPFVLLFFCMTIGVLTVIFPESTQQMGVLKGLGYSLLYTTVSFVAAHLGYLFCWFVMTKPRLNWLKEQIANSANLVADSELINQHIQREAKENKRYGLVLQDLIGEFAV